MLIEGEGLLFDTVLGFHAYTYFLLLCTRGRNVYTDFAESATGYFPIV